jgi:hypothetical protein
MAFLIGFTNNPVARQRFRTIPGKSMGKRKDQWPFQDPKMEILYIYHIRPYFVGYIPLHT